MAEAQKNVPIDETFHDQLKRIAIIDKTSMKNTVQKWIKKDGRGIEVPVRKQEKIDGPLNTDPAEMVAHPTGPAKSDPAAR